MTIQQVLLVRGPYATWNPSDKHADITLSNGNLTASGDPASIDTSVRATLGWSGGKWYWEITADTVFNTMIGIANSSMSLATYAGETADSWSYCNDGTTRHNSGDPPSSSAYGATWINGDVIGVALDMDGGTLTFYKNGVSQGQAYSSITGTIYPVFSARAPGTGSPSVCTANFGASAFAYTPPTGYGAL